MMVCPCHLTSGQNEMQIQADQKLLVQQSLTFVLFAHELILESLVAMKFKLGRLKLK
jgi:hypothetical protein